MEPLMKVIKLTRTSEFNEMQVEELALLYQETKDERYFNSILFNIFPFIIQRCNKYMTLNDEDKTSVALEKVHVALQKWNIKNGKFLTYYGTILNNELICMLEATMTLKAKALKESYSLERMVEDGYQPSQEVNTFSLPTFITECGFTEVESIVVEMLSKEYLIKEICDKLELSRRAYKETITNIQNKVKSNYVGTIDLDYTV